MIRPDAYRLKDNNDDALSEHLGTAMLFFHPLSFSLTITYLVYAPAKAPRPETLFDPGCLGAPLEYTTIIMLNDYLPVLFTYDGIPSYPTNGIVHSLVLPYVALL